jgi:hypothetical protein
MTTAVQSWVCKAIACHRQLTVAEAGIEVPAFSMVRAARAGQIFPITTTRIGREK